MPVWQEALLPWFLSHGPDGGKGERHKEGAVHTGALVLWKDELGNDGMHILRSRETDGAEKVLPLVTS